MQIDGPGSFLPTNLEGALTVLGILSAAVYAVWKWAIGPLMRADKAQRGELARLATVEQTVLGRLDTIERYMMEAQQDRNVVHGQLGEMKSEVRNLAENYRVESLHRANAQGEMSGQLRGIQDQLKMVVQLVTNRENHK